jgi:hypothetical protein
MTVKLMALKKPAKVSLVNGIEIQLPSGTQILLIPESSERIWNCIALSKTKVSNRSVLLYFPVHESFSAIPIDDLFEVELDKYLPKEWKECVALHNITSRPIKV